jgi:hypothetical protein
MTPSQLEHLKRIDAHLERLLDIASKRTPGEWDVENISPARHDVVKESGGKITSIFRAHDGCHEYREAALPDATFIAACAGNAEAGWRATRVAIACLLVICDPASGADFTNYGGETFLPQILAAFPLETLIS